MTREKGRLIVIRFASLANTRKPMGGLTTLFLASILLARKGSGKRCRIGVKLTLIYWALLRLSGGKTTWASGFLSVHCPKTCRSLFFPIIGLFGGSDPFAAPSPPYVVLLPTHFLVELIASFVQPSLMNSKTPSPRYLVTVPNALCGPNDSRAILILPCFSLVECRRTWRGAKGKRIYKKVN